MSVGSSRNHLSYYLLFKLCSLLSTIFISSPTFRDQGVLSDNDPPCTILVGVLVSRCKREVFAIKTRGYLLQVLPVRVPDCNIWLRHPAAPNHRTKRRYNKTTKEILISQTTT